MMMRTTKFHSVVITDNGYFYHYLRTGDVGTDQRLAVKYISEINTSRISS